MKNEVKCLTLFFVMILGCNPKNDGTATKEDILTSEGDQQFRAILMNPGEFDGVEIELTGIFTYEFENVAVYLTSGDANNLISRHAFWVNQFDVRDSLLDRKFRAANGKRVRVKGKFDKDDQGHLNSYAGTINEVKDLHFE